MKKLAILSTHPIQYNAPFFRMLHDDREIHLHVFFSKTWEQVKYDPDFQREIVWDIPISHGYLNSTFDASTKAGRISLAAAISEFQADALLIYGWNFPGHFTIMRKFSGSIPIWFRGDSHLLNPMSPWKKILRKALLSRIYAHVDIAFTVGSANEAYYLWSGMKTQQLIRAPHAVDTEYWMADNENRTTKAEEWRQQLSIPAKAKIVGYAGKIEPIKQVELIIKSTLSSGDTHHVVIAGSGPLEQKLKSSYGQNSRVHFLGFVNQSRMPIFFRMIDVLALASSSETWGLCVNEAMACGTPCLVSNRAGCSLDMFHHPGSGQVVPWNQPESWISALSEILQSPTQSIDWNPIVEDFHPGLFVNSIRNQFHSSHDQ